MKGPFSMALAKAYKFAKLAEKVTVYLLTEGLTTVQFPKIPVKIVASLEETIGQILASKPEASILIVPDAAGVFLNLLDQIIVGN